MDKDNFHKAMMIVNTAGWYKDRNAANVGCINGIRLDLDSINDGYDWRGPVADRILLPTAHIHEHISGVLREADKMMELAVSSGRPRWNTTEKTVSTSLFRAQSKALIRQQT